MAKKKEEVISNQSKKLAAIQAACAALQAKFGKESVNFLGNKKAEPIPRIPTGSLALDKVTGGGYPLGRIIELSGGPSSGKTTACYHAIAEAQRLFPDKWCGFVDSEYSADLQYAENVGVNVNELVVAQPDTGTDAFAMVQGMVEAGASLIVVDSVAAMLPKEESEEEDYGKASVGTQARMMSKGLRKLTAIVGKHKCVIIFTNQLRDKVGVLYGDPSVTSGGKSLQYYSSIRLKFTRIGKIDEKNGDDKIVTAIETKVEAIKNKTYRPYLVDKFTVVFGKGIDNDAGIVDLAISENIIVKKGGWYSIDGSNVAQGLVNLKAYLEANQDVYETIKAKVKEAIQPETDVDENQVSNIADADNMTDEEIAQKVMEEETEVGEV